MIDKFDNLVRQLVGRAVIIHKNKVLLVKSKNEPHFFLPGGRVDPGEGIVTCIVRELKEELDQFAVVKDYLGAVEHSFSNKKGSFYEVNHYFSAELSNPDVVVSAEELLVFEWVGIDELDKLDIEPKPVVDLLRNLLLKKEVGLFWGSTL